MSKESSAHPQHGLKHKFSVLLTTTFRRLPFLADLMRVVYGLLQPRYTAGVVGVVLNSKGEVLVAEHAFHPRNAWGLPGGWIGAHESPPDTITRELIEELNLEVEIICPLIIENGYYSKTHLDIAFLCRATGEVGELSYELLSYRWLPVDSLPLMLPFHRRAIEAAIKAGDGKKHE